MIWTMPYGAPMVHPVPDSLGLFGWIIVLCILVPLGSAAWDYFKKEWKDEI